jgi:hypothetical protein
VPLKAASIGFTEARRCHHRFHRCHGLLPSVSPMSRLATIGFTDVTGLLKVAEGC